MEIRYYRDPETGLPHFYNHGVTEAEAEWILAHSGEDEACPAAPGRRLGRRRMGAIPRFMSRTKQGTACLW